MEDDMTFMENNMMPEGDNTTSEDDMEEMEGDITPEDDIQITISIGRKKMDGGDRGKKPEKFYKRLFSKKKKNGDVGGGKLNQFTSQREGRLYGRAPILGSDRRMASIQIQSNDDLPLSSPSNVDQPFVHDIQSSPNDYVLPHRYTYLSPRPNPRITDRDLDVEQELSMLGARGMLGNRTPIDDDDDDEGGDDDDDDDDGGDGGDGGGDDSDDDDDGDGGGSGDDDDDDDDYDDDDSGGGGGSADYDVDGSSRLAGTSQSRKGKSKEDKRWILTSGIDGGPHNPDLLPSFLGHIAYFLWKGQDRAVLDTKKQHRLLKWNPHQESVKLYVQSTGLSHLSDCMYLELDMPLLSAFVERWQPDTNTFHMPFGEMTITLHDVYYLLKIRVDGDPVSETIDPDGLKKMQARLLRWSAQDVQVEWDKTHGKIKFSTLLETFSMCENAPKRVTKGYMLFLLGASLFVDKSGTMTNSYFLPYLDQIDKIGSYAWGTAALANLYRNLGVASRKDARMIGGCLTLLQAWIYEYFPMFRPTVRNDWDNSLPYAWRWIPAKQPQDHAALVRYRNQIDGLQAHDVTWTPFGPSSGGDVAISRFHGIIHCRNITEPYMPDRVMRQFGYLQLIPKEPFWPMRANRPCNTNMYVCEHDPFVAAWNSWQGHLLMFGNMAPRVKHVTDVVEDYMTWYHLHSHPFISNSGVDRYVQMVPSQMAPEARLQWLGNNIYPLHPSVRDTTEEHVFRAHLDAVCYHLEDLMPQLDPRLRQRGGSSQRGRGFGRRSKNRI